MYRAVMAPGITLAADELWVTTPWTWSPGGSCWRNRPIATWAIVSASWAFTPSQGAADACASRPVKRTSKCATARQVPVKRSAGQGWTIMAAWTPVKAPRSSIRILPPPPSSAGVPRTRTASPTSSATAESARPAPTAVAAMMLCPQAWPTSGNASYSAQTATTRSPPPDRASSAVARSYAPSVTSSPPARIVSATARAEAASPKHSSGVEWTK